MTRAIKVVYLMMFVIPVQVFAVNYANIYGGRDSAGAKKYIRWADTDSINISINYSPSDELTKVLYSCLVDYGQTSWDTASVESVSYDDETGEALIKIKLQYIWAKRFMRATLTKGGKLTCHGVRTD